MRNIFLICLLLINSVSHAGLFSKPPKRQFSANIDLIDGTHLEGPIIERSQNAYIIMNLENHQKTVVPFSKIKNIQEIPLSPEPQSQLLSHTVFDMADGEQLNGIIIEQGAGAYVILEPASGRKRLVPYADILHQREMSATEKKELVPPLVAQPYLRMPKLSNYKHTVQLGTGNNDITIMNNKYRMELSNDTTVLHYTYKPNSHLALRSSLSKNHILELNLDDNQSYPGQHIHTRSLDKELNIFGAEANLLLGNNFYNGINLYLGGGVGLQKHDGSYPIFAHEYGHTFQYLLGIGMSSKWVSIAIEYTDYQVSTPMLKYSQNIETYKSTTFNAGINF
jgi:opacity protein-like surface antigen